MENQNFGLEPVQVKMKYLRGAEFAPHKATADSAGADLRAAFAEPSRIVEPGERLAVPTGVAIEITRPGLAGFVFSRSGLGARDGLTVAQGVGLIDPDYRGEIIVWLLNTSREAREIKQGERIAQLVLLPYFPAAFCEVAELNDSDRGAGGFGHTGKH